MRLGFQRLLKLQLLFVIISFPSLALYSGLSQLEVVKQAVETFAIWYMVIAIVRQVGLFIGTIIYRARMKLWDWKARGFEPKVTVLVPAYNEGDVISGALENLFQVDYPNVEFLVIDDGSTDSTAARVFETIQRHENVECRLISKENGGKSSALNRGINEASGELILCVDADSHIDPKSIRKGVRHFTDSRVGAVSGFVRVASLKNILLRLQDLEYTITLNFARPALALSGAVTIVPGPAGMFRKDVLAEVGGYQEDKSVFAEDADLTVRVLAAGYRVTSEPNMISYTEAPESLMPLLRQRYRWNRGILQAIAKNLSKLLLDCGVRGKAIGFYMIFDAYLIRVVNFGLTAYFLGNLYSAGEAQLFTLWMTVLIGLDAVVISFTTRNLWEYFLNLGLMFFSRFSFGFILMTWGVVSLIDECLSVGMKWDKLDRTGQLNKAAA